MPVAETMNMYLNFVQLLSITSQLGVLEKRHIKNTTGSVVWGLSRPPGVISCQWGSRVIKTGHLKTDPVSVGHVGSVAHQGSLRAVIWCYSTVSNFKMCYVLVVS